jgi:hypothetical protein
MSKAKPTIVICSSAAFYRHVCELADQLEAKGFAVTIPATARKMRETNNFDVASHKTWFDNAEDFTIKQQLMDKHFDEIAKGDAILVVNDKKHGVEGYIGANVLMEMAIAYYLKKKIYVLNTVTRDMNSYEEVMGMQAVQLDDNLNKIEV